MIIGTKLHTYSDEIMVMMDRHTLLNKVHCSCLLCSIFDLIALSLSIDRIERECHCLGDMSIVSWVLFVGHFLKKTKFKFDRYILL